MMELASRSNGRLDMPDVERERITAELYYYRATLAEVPGNEVAIYFVEMTIIELNSHSEARRSP